mgnify:CR=1 FL=1|jgi:hypothetical protein
MAPKLKKDGTERKSYVRKTQAQENEREENPKPILQRPMQSEEQIEQQRAIMRQTLRGIAEPMRDRFEIGSCYDCALGLEIWLSDNSKVRVLRLLLCVCVCVCVFAFDFVPRECSCSSESECSMFDVRRSIFFFFVESVYGSIKRSILLCPLSLSLSLSALIR